MSSPIVESGTYNLLLGMGFPAHLSLIATKIYLNDIEEAVNYCSGFSSPDSPIYSSMNRKRDNYKKCYDLLQLSHPKYLSLFENWFNEEEFEDAQLIEEFIENCDFKESFFIQYIYENAEGILVSDCDAMNLFCDISSALKPKAKLCLHHTLIDGYIRQIKCYTSIPSTLNVLCDRYYSKFGDGIINIDLSLDHNMKNDYLNDCSALFPAQHRLDDSLFELFVIGTQNNMPLLTYLTDSYNRSRINCAKKISQILSAIPQRKLKRFKSQYRIEAVTVESFITELNLSQSFENICIKSMNALMDKSALSKPTLQCNSLYRIDDDYMEIVYYIFESYSFIESYIHNTLKYDQMPAQFDIQIIPRRVICEDDNEYVCMTSDDVNIVEILIDTNCKYLFGFEINAKEMETLTKELIGDNSNQRCCVCIDRRQNEDQMFIYQRGDESDTINLSPNESLFDNSVRCLVPTLCGAKDHLNGYMLTLSFHVISKYEVRIYLYIDGFATRFYIQDLVQYLPQFFEMNELQLIRKVLSTQSNESIAFYNKLAKCKNMLTDSKFDEFYSLISMD